MMVFPLGLAENSIQLVPDGTLILHVLIILVMIYVLNATLYKPINQILEAREQRTKGRLSEAQEILKSVSDKVAAYERALRQARGEAYAFAETERGAAMQERQLKLNEMRQQEPRWWDYPGFELWKFINLGFFVLVLVYILTKKANIGEAFRNRREGIKRELARAREERDAAIARLKEIEERLARLDSEVVTIRENSKVEAAEERERIARSTETEIARLSEGAQREIENAGKAAKKELRRYTAEQSVQLAEGLIRREMQPEDDARLVNRNIEDLGGMSQ